MCGDRSTNPSQDLSSALYLLKLKVRSGGGEGRFAGEVVVGAGRAASQGRHHQGQGDHDGHLHRLLL